MTLGKWLGIIKYHFIAFPTQTVEIGWDYKKKGWNCSKLFDKWTTYDGRLLPEQIAIDHLRNSDDFELLSTFLAIAFFLKKCFTVQVANLWGIISLCVYLFFKFMTFHCFAESSFFCNLVNRYCHLSTLVLNSIFNKLSILVTLTACTHNYMCAITLRNKTLTVFLLSLQYLDH